MFKEQQDLYSWYQTMRETSPVYYDEQRNVWHAFGYLDVQRVLQDWSTFSSQKTHGGEMAVVTLLETDPPRHRQLRSLVMQAFTPRRIAELEGRITTLVNELLEPGREKGEMDIITDLAYPLPTIVIAELLGVSASDHERFKYWSDTISEELPNLKPGEVSQAQQEMAGYLFQTLAERRQAPKDDLISSLLAAEVEGERLSDYDIVATCALLLITGHETTTNLLGNAVLSLLEEREVLQELSAEPELLPAAIEEVIRYRSPVVSTPRRTSVETTLGDQKIPADSLVVAQIGSANRDASIFPDADRLLIRRTPNRHLGFGHGAHFCLGAPLARLESKIALTAMLKMLSTSQIRDDKPLEPAVGFGVFAQGVKSLPITFTPGK
jgi:cytochrome P450